MPALAPQQHIAGDGGIALGTERANRTDHRHVARQTKYTNVEKTADDQSEERGQKCFDQASTFSYTATVSFTIRSTEKRCSTRRLASLASRLARAGSPNSREIAAAI